MPNEPSEEAIEAAVGINLHNDFNCPSKWMGKLLKAAYTIDFAVLQAENERLQEIVDDAKIRMADKQQRLDALAAELQQAREEIGWLKRDLVGMTKQRDDEVRKKRVGYAFKNKNQKGETPAETTPEERLGTTAQSEGGADRLSSYQEAEDSSLTNRAISEGLSLLGQLQVTRYERDDLAQQLAQSQRQLGEILDEQSAFFKSDGKDEKFKAEHNACDTTIHALQRRLDEAVGLLCQAHIYCKGDDASTSYGELRVGRQISAFLAAKRKPTP